MDLQFKEAVPRPAQYDSTETAALTAGTRFQIRDNETGSIVNRLDEVVPSGKVWTLTVAIHVIETDA